MSVCPVEYWIWMQNSLGAGARTDEILSYFESPEGLYNAGSKEWRLSGLLTQRKIEALKSSTPSEVRSVLNECRQRGYKLITPDTPEYPERLKSLSDMPLVLYSLGDSDVLNDELSLGIVGTRNASEYGVQVAQKLSYTLADAGATIVSGGALGVDSEAHAGAMLAKGRTLAFLGCGLSYDYLRENASLRRAITRYGAVVSEFPPLSPATRTSFPIRNRLISGVSLGVVVVEAGVKSGSLITATRALEQGKDVFAIPGDIIRSSFDGTNHLIKNGAKPVFSAEDILCEYEYRYSELIKKEKMGVAISDVPYVEYRKKKSQSAVAAAPASADSEAADELSNEARLVLSVLNSDGTHIDDIVRQTNLKMNIVLSSLTELELLGRAELVSGKKYKSI